MTPLSGQRIVLIGIGFYDYEAAIAAEFRALGAEVWVENEQPPEMRGRLSPLRRRALPDMSGPLRRHRAALLTRIRALGPLDHVVVIKGALLDEPFLKALRAAQPKAHLTAYHWDSLSRFPELIERQALFDRVLTFDHADAAAHPDFILRPLFFRPELLAPGYAEPIDLCFVGWLHHDRLRQVETLRAQAQTLGLSSFFYFFTGLWTGLSLRFSGKSTDVHVRPLPFARYVEKVAAARIVVDLPHPMQTGLTMRGIEAVGASKKLLTTAQDITNYDFYRPENVAVLDPDRPRIDPHFLSLAAAPTPLAIVERYSLRAWALDVLGCTEPAGFIGRPDLNCVA
jgi:hypothetical protein